MKENLKNHKHFLAAMYLRLSRDDNATKGSSITKGESTAKSGSTVDAAGIKSESNSIGSQRELIRAYIQEQPDIELYDIYMDDTAIIRLNQKTFCLRGLPIKSYFFTLFTHPHLPRGEFLPRKPRKENSEWQKS